MLLLNPWLWLQSAEGGMREQKRRRCGGLKEAEWSRADTCGMRLGVAADSAGRI